MVIAQKFAQGEWDIFHFGDTFFDIIFFPFVISHFEPFGHFFILSKCRNFETFGKQIPIKTSYGISMSSKKTHFFGPDPTGSPEVYTTR